MHKYSGISQQIPAQGLGTDKDYTYSSCKHLPKMNLAPTEITPIISTLLNHQKLIDSF